MPELEQRLRELGQRLDYPPAASLATAVRRRIEAPAFKRSPWPRLLPAAAAIAVLVIAALLAVPASRNAIAGFLGLRGVIVERVPAVPSPSAPPTGSIGARLGLGTEVTLAQARAAVPYAVLVPAGLGEPDHVYLMDPRSRQAVALVYLPRPDLPASAQTGVGLLLVEFPGSLQSAFMEKMLGPEATLEPVTVEGRPGFWVSGAPHGFFYLDPRGEILDDTFRLAGNTLLWTQGRLTLRIEASLGKDRALALAASLR